MAQKRRERCRSWNQECPLRIIIRHGKRTPVVASAMIGIDPHKASHTAVAIGGSEEALGELRVRASGAQAERLRHLRFHAIA